MKKELDILRNSIVRSWESGGKAEVTNVGFVSDIFGPTHLLFSLLYYYFVLYVYFICVTSCLAFTNIKYDNFFTTKIERLLLANIELRILLGYFYLILISFVMRRSISHSPLKDKLLTKLRLQKPRKYIHN